MELIYKIVSQTSFEIFVVVKYGSASRPDNFAKHAVSVLLYSFLIEHNNRVVCVCILIKISSLPEENNGECLAVYYSSSSLVLKWSSTLFPV